MKKVVVRKSDLITVLTENREKHLVEYKVMKDRYYESLMIEIKNIIPDIESKIKINLNPLKNVPTPKLNVGSYDRAIKMSEMSVEDELEMTEQEFNELVMDEWSWSRDFTLSKMTYGIE